MPLKLPKEMYDGLLRLKTLRREWIHNSKSEPSQFIPDILTMLEIPKDREWLEAFYDFEPLGKLTCYKFQLENKDPTGPGGDWTAVRYFVQEDGELLFWKLTDRMDY